MRTSVKHPTLRKLAAKGYGHKSDDIAVTIGAFLTVWYVVYFTVRWRAPWDALPPFILDIIHIISGIRQGHFGVLLKRPLLVIAFVIAICVAIYAEHSWNALQSDEAARLQDEKREAIKKSLRNANLVAGTKVREGFRYATQLANERTKTIRVDQNKTADTKTFRMPSKPPTRTEIVAQIHEADRQARTRIPATSNDATRQLQRWLSEAGVKWSTQVTVTRVTESHGDKYMYVTLTGKHGDEYLTSKHLANLAPVIAYHMERPTEDVAVAEEGSPNRAKIRVKAAVAAAVIQPGPWPNGHAHSILEPVKWGRDNTGHEVELVLFESGRGSRMGAIGGSKGAGKSGAIHPIIAHCVLAPDCEVWGIDMKGGVEFALWGQAMSRLAIDNTECEALLDDLYREVKRRQQFLLDNNMRVWRPTPENPVIQLFVDEMAQISKRKRKTDDGHEEHSPQEKLLLIAQLGRACGIGVVGATQRLSGTQVNTDLRSQLDDYDLALRCRSITESIMVLAHQDVDASRISPDAPGTAYIDGVARRTILARSYWLDDPTIAQIVATHPKGVDTQPTQPQNVVVDPQIQGGGVDTIQPLVGALGPGRARMLELVTENPGLSIRKYAQEAGISENAAHKSLKWLRDNGYVTKDWRPVESDLP